MWAETEPDKLIHLKMQRSLKYSLLSNLPSVPEGAARPEVLPDNQT